MYEGIVKAVFALGRVTPNGVTPLGNVIVLNRDGLLVTAAHVTNHDDNNLVVIFPRNNSLSEYQNMSNLEIRYVEVKIKSVNPLYDICILEGANGTNLRGTSNLNITGLDNINVGEKLNVFGFPDLNFGRMILTKQETDLGAKVLIENTGFKVKYGVINLLSRQGQSGSPVIHNNNLIGILIGPYLPKQSGGISIGGIDPHTLHPATHIVSASYIEEMLEENV